MRRDVLASPLVARQLAHLKAGARRVEQGSFDGFGGIHGSAPETIENALAKLTDLGLHAGVAELDRAAAPYQRWLDGPATGHPGSALARTIVAAFLARAGYTGDHAVDTVLRTRLSLLDTFAKQRDYAIYREPPKSPRMPAAFRDRPLVREDLHSEAGLRVPWIHDLIGIGCLPRSAVTTRRSASVMRYVLDERYQALPDAYGIVLHSTGRYYAIGWDIKLPGFAGFPPAPSKARCLIQRTSFLARFATARAHPYVAGALAHLRGFRTDEGRYCFPSEYRRDYPSYWVHGSYRLEASQRQRLAAELDSTFWMLWLESLVASRRSGVA